MTNFQMEGLKSSEIRAENRGPSWDVEGYVTISQAAAEKCQECDDLSA